jgi:hypothetical protein
MILLLGSSRQPQISHTISTLVEIRYVLYSLYPGEISDARFVQHSRSAPTTVLTADLSIARIVFRASKSLQSLSSLFSMDYQRIPARRAALKHFGDRPFASVYQEE